MGIEAISLFYKRGTDCAIEEEEVYVGPGDVQQINNADVILAQAIVNIDDTLGTVHVVPGRRIEGWVSSEDDEEGIDVDLSRPIVLIEGEILTVSKKTKGGIREIVFVFGSDEDYDEDERSSLPSPADNVPILT